MRTEEATAKNTSSELRRRSKSALKRSTGLLVSDVKMQNRELGLHDSVLNERKHSIVVQPTDGDTLNVNFSKSGIRHDHHRHKRRRHNIIDKTDIQSNLKRLAPMYRRRIFYEQLRRYWPVFIITGLLFLSLLAGVVVLLLTDSGERIIENKQPIAPVHGRWGLINFNGMTAQYIVGEIKTKNQSITNTVEEAIKSIYLAVGLPVIKTSIFFFNDSKAVLEKFANNENTLVLEHTAFLSQNISDHKNNIDLKELVNSVRKLLANNKNWVCDPNIVSIRRGTVSSQANSVDSFLQSEFPAYDLQQRGRKTVTSLSLTTCDVMSPVKNGTIVPDDCVVQGKVHVGLACTTACHTGFVFSGSNVRLCLSTGVWSGLETRCERVCPKLKHPANGVVSPNHCFQNNMAANNLPILTGTHCHYSCAPGFTLVGNFRTTCKNDGTWTSVPSICKRTCAGIVPSQNGYVIPAACSKSWVEEEKFCSFYCEEGYVMQGETTATCENDGTWTADPPLCAKTCPGFSVLKNGNIHPSVCYKGQSDIGARCTFSCSPGYELYGSQERMCSSDGKWSGSPSECIRVCLRLKMSRYHRTSISCSLRLSSAGTKCNISCEQGFEVEGSTEILCQKDGTWNKGLPTCRAKCPQLPKPSSGHLVCSGYVEGSSCSLFCSPQNILHDAGSVVCRADGSWSEPIGYCVNTCQKYTAPNNVKINPETCGYEISLTGQICFFKCTNGYGVSGHLSTECLPNGLWSNNDTKCVKEDQYFIQIDTQDLKMCLQLNPNTSHVEKREWVECMSDPRFSKWSLLPNRHVRNTDSNLCLAAKLVSAVYFLISEPCDETDAMQIWDWPSTNDVQYLKIKARKIYLWEGYYSFSRIVSVTDKSQLESKWSLFDVTRHTTASFFGVANEGKCPSLTNGQTGRWSPSSCTSSTTKNHAYCTYVCLPGYTSRGQDMENQCLDGIWSNANLFECVLGCSGLDIDLPELISILPSTCMNGYVEEQTICTATCPSNTVLVGERYIICLMGGMWSFSPPACLSLCEPLAVNGSGYVLKSDKCYDRDNLHREGSVCEVECDEGYMLSTTPMYTCVDGEWDNDHPICKRKCDVPNSSSHTLGSCLGVTKFYVEGESCSFSCPPGYKFADNTTATITCMQSGVWSSNTPICMKLCPDIVVTSALVLSSPECSNADGVLEGVTCVISCHPGYILTGSSIRTCLSTGVWSGYNSNCQPNKQFLLWNENIYHKQCMSVSFSSHHNSYKVVLKNYSNCSETNLMDLWSSTIDDKIRHVGSPWCLGIEAFEENALVQLQSCESSHSPQWKCLLRHGYYVLTTRDKYYLHTERNATVVDIVTTFDENYHNRDEYGWKVSDLNGNIGSVCGSSHNKCPTISLTSYAFFSPRDIHCLSYVDLGSNCTIFCSDNPRESVGTLYECEKFGLWNRNDIDCSHNSCPPISIPLNAAINDENCLNSNSSTNDSRICVVNCNPGFVRRSLNVYTDEMVCTVSGEWSEPPPKCLSNCSMLFFPSDVGVSSNCDKNSSFLDGDVCNFTCGFNYNMVGDSSIQCDDGVWNPLPPRCLEVLPLSSPTCTGPILRANGRVLPLDCSHNSVGYSTTCKITCDSGYLPDRNGNTEIQCQSNGEWTGSITQCLRTCDSFDFLSATNKALNGPKFFQSPERCYTGNNTVGDVCYLDCIDEYEIFAGPYSYNTKSYITCQENGKWFSSMNEEAYSCVKVPQFKIQSRHTGLCVNAINAQLIVYTDCDSNVRSMMWVFYKYVLKNRGNLNLCLSAENHKFLSRVYLAPCNLTDVQQRWDCGVGEREHEVINYYVDVKLTQISHSNRVYAIKTKNQDYSLTAISLFDPKDGKDEWTEMSSEHICGRRNEADMCMIRKWDNILNGHASTNCRLQPSILPDYDWIEFNEVCQFDCNENYTLSGSSSAQCLWRGQWEYSEEPVCIRKCPLLSRAKHSHVKRGDCNTKLSIPEETCEFACDSGFIGVGDSIRACRSTGKWSGIALFCYQPCDPIRHQYAASIHPPECTKKLQNAGAICTTICNDGYDIEGKSSQICQVDGQWSNAQGTCSILCPILLALSHGVIAPSDCLKMKKKPGSSCFFQCSSGYKLIGPETRTCGISGLWSEKSAQCLRKCPVLPSPANGYLVMENRYINVEGARIKTTCKVNFRTDNNPNRECLSNGQWTGDAAACIHEHQFILAQSSPPSPTICIFADRTSNLLISNFADCELTSPWQRWAWRGTSHIRSVGTDKCLTGSLESDKYLVLEDCDDNNSGQRWECLKNDLKSLIALTEYNLIPLYGSLSYSKVLLLKQDMIEFLNQKSILPAAYLQWYAKTSENNQTSLCSAREVSACNGFMFEKHLVVSPSKCRKSEIAIGTECTFKCDNGYILKTKISSMLCLNSGYWTEPTPSCVPSCKRLDIDTGVRVLPENCLDSTMFPEGHMCRFSCSSTDLLVGASISTCLRSGIWSSVAPLCKRTCVTLNVPLRGAILPTWCTDLGQRIVEGTECTISCLQQSHILSGSHTRVCTSKGMWTGYDSECIKPCQVLQVPSYAKISPVSCIQKKAQIGTICVFSCNEGYFPKVAYHKECLSNGTWDGPELHCQKYCPPLKKLTTRGVIYPASCTQADNAPGSTCSIKCDTGYDVVGDKFVTCTENEKWNGAFGKCNRKCPRLKNPVHGYIDPPICRSGDIYSGTICVSSCQKHHILRGSNSRICTDDGYWTGTEAVCVPSCVAIGKIETSHVFPATCVDNPQSALTVCTVECVNDTLTSQGTRITNLTCMPNGLWDKLAPKKCLKTCSVPEVSDGRVLCKSRFSNSVTEYVLEEDKCTIECAKYHVPSTHPTSKCVNGKWLPEITTCSYIPYPLLMVQRVGFVTKCLGITQTFTTMYSWEMCSNEESGTKWAWRSRYSIVNLVSGLCLSASVTALDGPVIVSPCDDYDPLQHWDCALDEPYRFFLNGTSLGPGRKYSGLDEITLQEDVVPETMFYTFNPNSKTELGTLCSLRPERGCNRLLIPEGVEVLQSECYDSTVSPGTVCRLNCTDAHHIISGAEAVECQDSGVWFPEHPGECKLHCPPLESLSEEVFYDTDACIYETANVGTICFYKCRDRHVLISDLKGRECLSNGIWSEAAKPVCKLSCPVIEHPKNAMLYPHSCSIGVCTIECDVGYKLNGPKTKSCQDNGEWSGNEFSCTEDTQFAIVTNIVPLRMTMCLTVVNTDHVIKTPCKHEQRSQMWRWNSHFLFENIATESCLAYRDDDREDLFFSENMQFRKRSKVTADTLYDLQSFRDSSEPSDVYVTDCNATDGYQRWKCDTTSPLNRFRVLLSDLGLYLNSGPQFSTRVTLSNQSSNSVRWFISDYFGISTICSRRSTGVCSPFYQLYGGGVLPAVCMSDFITVGTQCHFYCNSAYVIEGQKSATCQSNGFWTNELPSCVGVSKCPALQVFEPLMVRPSVCDKRAPVGKRCFFKCRQTHDLYGEESLMCHDNQTWSGKLPVCKAFCPALSPPLNGTIFPESCQNSGNIVGMNCSFRCHTGFDMIGHKNIFCQENGFWTGKNTLCRKLCPKVKLTENLIATPNSCAFGKSPIGSTCVFTCYSGFGLVGSSRLECRNGVWSDPLPSCRNDFCIRYSAGDNGIQSVSYANLINNAIVHDTTVDYTCLKSFIINGQDARTCMHDGSWSGPEDLCSPIQCPTLLRLYHGTIEPISCILSLSNTGTLCSFSCDHGFMLSGPTSIECLTVGRWSDRELPQCHDTRESAYSRNFMVMAAPHNDSKSEDVAFKTRCIEATKGESQNVLLSDCKTLTPFKQWRWYGSSRVQNVANQLCWELKENSILGLNKCNLNSSRQEIFCGDIKSVLFSFQITISGYVLTHNLITISRATFENFDWIAVDTQNVKIEEKINPRSYGVPICSFMCGGEVVANGGDFATPRFPSTYPRNIECKWTLNAPEKVIHIDFSSIKLPNQYIHMDNCMGDKISIFEGDNGDYENSDELISICSETNSLSVKSLHGVLHIQFYSDNDAKDNKKGFSARWFTEEPISPYKTCGGSNTSTPDYQNTTVYGYPWYVTLYTWKRLCDGTIIGNQFVMTSGQCVEHVLSADDIRSLFVGYSFSSQSEFLSRIKRREFNHADRIWIHEDYSPEMLLNNLAIIKLMRPIDDPKNLLQSICLPSPEQGRVEKAGDDCVISGISKSLVSHPSSSWRFSKVARARILSHTVCDNMLLFERGIPFKKRTFLCAEIFYDSDNRPGLMYENDYIDNDGGTILQCLWNENWYAVGLFNFALDDIADKTFYVFTKILDKHGWIEDVIDNAFLKPSNVFS